MQQFYYVPNFHRSGGGEISEVVPKPGHTSRCFRLSSNKACIINFELYLQLVWYSWGIPISRAMLQLHLSEYGILRVHLKYTFNRIKSGHGIKPLWGKFVDSAVEVCILSEALAFLV